MKKLFLLPLIIGVQAHALTCQTDQDCFSFTLSLIKKATKLNVCRSESATAAKSIQIIANPKDGSIEALRDCVETKSYAAKLEKRMKKRVERIQKALQTSEVKS